MSINKVNVVDTSKITPKIGQITVDSVNYQNSGTNYVSTNYTYEELDYSNYEEERISLTPITKEEYIKECQKIYFTTHKFFEYKVFVKYLVPDKFISKPLRDTSYATQGCCEVNGTTFITSYDTGYHYSDGSAYSLDRRYSVLSILFDNWTQKNIYLDNYEHVGGIAYHEGSNKLYIPGAYGENERKCINIYDVDTVKGTQDGSMAFPEKRVYLDEIGGVEKASYVNVHGDYLYIGEFRKNAHGKMCKYKIDEDGNLTLEETIIPPVKNVQGMCIYEKNGKTYYVFSSSHGRENDSKLYIYEMGANGNFGAPITINMPCMAEQVSIDGENNLMIVFESDCSKYGDGADGKGKANEQIGNVCYLDMEHILNDSRDPSNFHDFFMV